MPESRRWIDATRGIAGGLVLGGLLLMSWSWWFLLLVAAGSFGPGVLRELGLLSDRDEFQRGADHRAGYIAFLTCGIVAALLVAFIRSGERELGDPEELATLFLVLLWSTWLFSTLCGYWGAGRCASRILVAFGLAWLVFTIVSNLGSEWSGWAALLLHPLLTLPFFVLAWLAGRMPRLAGALLVVGAAFFTHFFGFFQRSNQGLVSQGVTFVLFVGPLLASGIALLVAGQGERDEEGAVS